MQNPSEFHLSQEVLDWLLDSDPALEWQVRKNLLCAPAKNYEAVRRRVAHEGWGKQVLDAQQEDGSWAGAAFNQEKTSTFHALTLVYLLGVDPMDPKVQTAVKKVRENVRWADDPRFAGNPYFEGEIEPCINGAVATAAIYFRQDVSVIMRKLLKDQKADGGWNCDEDSTVSSFNSTIDVLEALLAYEQHVDEDQKIKEARERGEEYLLSRHLFRRLSGEIIPRDNWYRPLGGPAFTSLGFPTWWHYDILRGLDYFRRAGRSDPRQQEALQLLREKQQPDGRWLIEVDYGGEKLVDFGEIEGEPSKWLTYQAALVLTPEADNPLV
ncbi:MAG: hypothetical protein PHW11_09970 [Anaerolineaceae bacterium]|nr:hypothetical protein [Anaerolineaceae bacterium]MDD4043378.1 hypothetical protein [Anaerolineaceae bacterium]MDD4578301.1 hypothetical protein [Anaerolineaceae bacterium]